MFLVKERHSLRLFSVASASAVTISIVPHKHRLLRWTYPQLHAHFAAIELSPEVITAQWFLTLFTYTFPVVPTVLQLWDYIFLTGWEGNCYERLICYCICTVDNGEQTVLLVYF